MKSTAHCLLADLLTICKWEKSNNRYGFQSYRIGGEKGKIKHRTNETVQMIQFPFSIPFYISFHFNLTFKRVVNRQQKNERPKQENIIKLENYLIIKIMKNLTLFSDYSQYTVQIFQDIFFFPVVHFMFNCCK